METFGHFRFSIIRYVPDVVRAEGINIGVLISDVSGLRTPMVRFTSSWERVLAFDPDADLQMLRALEQDLSLRFAETSNANSLMNSIQDSFSLNLEVTNLKGCTAESMDSLAVDLLTRYVNPSPKKNVLKMAGTG